MKAMRAVELHDKPPLTKLLPLALDGLRLAPYRRATAT
jgi:hypothetical protein